MNQTFTFTEDIDATLYNEMYTNDFYKQIINTAAFERLENISFLGAIDKVCDNKKYIANSRYQHSLDVAKLALFICKERKYSAEIEKHIVTAALLHDVGHAPLSHSMEPSFVKKYGLDHHTVGENIIKGKDGKSSELSKYLSQHLDVDFLVSLLNKQSTEEYSDIFSSSINVDTIDGIHKSLRFLFGGEKQSFNKYSVAKAAFLPCERRKKVLDQFWQYKGLVYDQVITSAKGILADFFSQRFFDDNSHQIDESHFTSTEIPFLGTNKPIFKSFRTEFNAVEIINDSSDIWATFSQRQDIKTTKRFYMINEEIEVDSEMTSLETINSRYRCIKEPQVMTLLYCMKEDKKKLQYSFRGCPR